jgi:hypothetical protein
MKMDIDVNSVRVHLYLDIIKETFDYIGTPSLQKNDEVTRMYKDQMATFHGKGSAVFKCRDHATEDVFYVVPQDPLTY